MAFLRKEKWFRSAPEGFWRHMQGVCWYLVCWVQHKVLWYSLMQSKAYTDWKIQRNVSMDNAIYPLLQCQSSSGSVGKSIWLEFRRPGFESWLDLNVFFSPSNNSANKTSFSPLRDSNGTCKLSADTQFTGCAAQGTSVLTNAKAYRLRDPAWDSKCV